MAIGCLLIANRGEVVCRIARTAKRLGMRTLAVYSQADAEALHVRQADEALCIGPPPAADSYLNIAAILAAAQDGGADAVHPGYGFLSENAQFAQACEDAGLLFVGPPSAAIRAMGSKIEAKRLAVEVGVPVIPGYDGEDQSDAAMLVAARQLGFPLFVKAAAGGGGRGMRLVAAAADLPAALAGARREAEAAFADDRLLLERCLVDPKHLEVQILADRHGQVLSLFERDCSVQRRYQKVIEEAPGPTVRPALRQRLSEAAIQVARAVSYVGAGTVEFIADGGRFHFMEMNTRLQVEHPVTEAIAGLDLVEWQLRIAAGEPLNIRPVASGHAIEARLYAENPAKGFAPCAGRLHRLRLPENGSDAIRVDVGVEEGDLAPVHYDPMLAKLIAWGPDRETARAALIEALESTEIAGIEHNAGYLRRLLAHPRFAAGDYGTGLAEAVHEEVAPRAEDLHWALAAAATVQSGSHPWLRADGWRPNQQPQFAVHLRQDAEMRSVLFDGKRIAAGETAFRHDGLAQLWEVEAALEDAESQARPPAVSVGGRCTSPGHSGRLRIRLNGRRHAFSVQAVGHRLHLMLRGDSFVFERLQDDADRRDDRLADPERIVSPMPGQVVGLAVALGDRVQRGDLLAVVEAMKMEHSIRAPWAGEVAAIACAPGQWVDENARLVVLKR